jgi:flavodoxin short chain
MGKVAIVYWSGTGNTEAMANAIAKGLKAAKEEPEIIPVSSADAQAVLGFGKIAFGCPSMGVETLEESEFEPFFQSVEGGLGGKKIALFGSYGWGDGEWMRDWQARAESSGALVFEEGLAAHESPDENVCVEFGKRFASA